MIEIVGKRKVNGSGVRGFTLVSFKMLKKDNLPDLYVKQATFRCYRLKINDSKFCIQSDKGYKNYAIGDFIPKDQFFEMYDNLKKCGDSLRSCNNQLKTINENWQGSFSAKI